MDASLFEQTCLIVKTIFDWNNDESNKCENAFEIIPFWYNKAQYNKFVRTKMRPKGGTKFFLNQNFEILFSMVQWYFKGYLQSGIHISAFSMIL